jgi:hypothetical protein
MPSTSVSMRERATTWKYAALLDAAPGPTAALSAARENKDDRHAQQ